MTEENPLNCLICEKELFDPILLPCQHTVCRRCATSSTCHLCHPNNIPSSSSQQSDKLAAFLLDASKEVAEVCANCEKSCLPMFFCETCQQSLCLTCRQTTHQAKMFATHRIINADERNKVFGSSLCRDHNEPYILYCSDVRKLVCIQCFNGRPIEERHSFISIDQGHRMSLEKIEQSAAKLRIYQNLKIEEIKVRQRIIEENASNFEDVKKSVVQLCQQIIDTVLATREKLIKGLEKERESLNEQCRQQIREIESVMSPVRLCLFASQILCSSASKIDALQLSLHLQKRINNILERTIAPLNTSVTTSSTLINDIDGIEVRSELAKAVEPYIGLSAAWCPISAASREGSSSASYKRSSASMPMLSKFQATIDLAGEFGQMFSRVEHPLRQLVAELASTSQQVLETQRDLTTRKCLIDTETVRKIVKTTRRIEASLGMQSAALDGMQSEVQEIWQEQLDRVRRQQILYREKVDEVFRHRETARQVLTAAKQLVPYVQIIHKMNAMIDPKRCHPPDPAPMESICLEITGIEPNSETRIQAIEKEEENRRLIQEAKKKEELAEHGAVVKMLKHHPVKNRKKERDRTTTLMLVNTNRERSPGGTDGTLISPCTRRILTNSTLREETNSELEEYLDENFDFFSGIVEEETVERQLTEKARWSSELNISSTLSSSLPSLDQLLGFNRHQLACRVTQDVGLCRGAMLQSLNDVFAIQKPTMPENLHVSEERNVLASAVRESEKKRKEPIEKDSKPIALPRRKTKKRTKKNEDIIDVGCRENGDDDVNQSTSPPPPVPFVPKEIFEKIGDVDEKLGSFEAKERVLQSLMQKMGIKEQEDDK